MCRKEMDNSMFYPMVKGEQDTNQYNLYSHDFPRLSMSIFMYLMIGKKHYKFKKEDKGEKAHSTYYH